jgi:hypothetical protein
VTTPQHPPQSERDTTMPITFHVYFVSFAHANGFGNLEISMRAPITGIADVKAIAEFLRARATDPVVLYYNLLRTDVVS